MTFDRLSYFDRSFFDRILSGTSLPARIAGKFAVTKRTSAFTLGFRADIFTVTIRTRAFTVVASK